MSGHLFLADVVHSDYAENSDDETKKDEDDLEEIDGTRQARSNFPTIRKKTKKIRLELNRSSAPAVHTMNCSLIQYSVFPLVENLMLLFRLPGSSVQSIIPATGQWVPLLLLDNNAGSYRGLIGGLLYCQSRKINILSFAKSCQHSNSTLYKVCA